jgi:SEC-C motif-containing protein
MRARYCAYVQGEIDYIHNTLHPDHRADHDLEAARKWSRDSQWLGLEIIATGQGGEADQHGVVEFKASYRDRGGLRQAHEVSQFERVGGAWVYVDGEMPKPETVRNSGSKVGRNEPCPCGSGKKYKKCCGR